MVRRLLAIAGLLTVAGLAAWLVLPRVQQGKKIDPLVAERLPADAAFAGRPNEAAKLYEEFIAKHKDNPDPKVQDHVGSARIKLGYIAGRSGDYKVARAKFLQAANEYRGSGSIGEDFGGVKDQAAYQAAVTYAAEGRKKEAIAAFEEFIKDYSLSPLVHAAHGRLRRLNGGNSTRRWDDLLQAAVSKQEKHIRFETSVCGPKAIAYVLEQLGRPTKDYKELAKLCGTTDTGTTMEGMVKGLQACGLSAKGYLMNRKDFAALRSPAILLDSEHYTVLLEVEDSAARVYDPVNNSERQVKLPPLDSTDFSAVVLRIQVNR